LPASESHPNLQDPWRIVHVMWSTAFAAYFRDNFSAVRDQLTPGLVDVIEQGLDFSGADVADAYIQRNVYYESWRAFLQTYDLVLTPTLP
jgi:Asp-tRNA(Asn)/Glu-tRNA(Gln) amidotransferase A subunit family amidase